MSSDAALIFDAQAGCYDELRRLLVPPFDALYGAAVGALALACRPPRRVLDLGAGTGLLSGLVRREYREVELVLLDGAPAMLERARGTLGNADTSFCVADLCDPLPEGRFGAVVSALAIHHLHDLEKRELFAHIHDALEPGGVFVNAEQVAAPSEALECHYRQWHRESSLELGASTQEWAEAKRRMTFDRCATVGEQLSWLIEAGFAETDCIYKQHSFAVIFARRDAQARA